MGRVKRLVERVRRTAGGRGTAWAEHDFDATWYLDAYPDVALAGVDPLRHFAEHGDAEGRSPGPSFDATFYRQAYLPLGSTHAYRHYVERGRADGLLPRPVPRSREDSAEHLRQVLAHRSKPLVVVGHDAQRAGGPLLARRLMQHATVRGWQPILLLRDGGPLLAELRREVPTILLSEGWDREGLGGAIPSGVPILGNTGWSAPVIQSLERPDLAATVLVHEMTPYLEQHQLTTPLAAMDRLVVGMPSMAPVLSAALPDVGPLPRVVVARPGLTSAPPSDRDRKEVGRALSDRWPVPGLLFLGAGYADPRKGFDRFLVAAERIRRLDDSARFVWLGELSTWAQQLAERAAAEGLPLWCPGFTDKAEAWYVHADAYLLTSRQDPGPQTCMDAARMGVGFVGYADDIGLRSAEGLTDDVGVFVRPDDVESMAAEALQFAREDAGRREHRAAYVEARTGFGSYADEILGLLSAT